MVNFSPLLGGMGIVLPPWSNTDPTPISRNPIWQIAPAEPVASSHILQCLTITWRSHRKIYNSRTSRPSSIKPYIAMFKPLLLEEVIRKEKYQSNSDLNKKSLWLSASQIRGRGRNCWQGKCSGWEKFAKIKIALKGISKMALTELERQKDSISWEPISERADFITTLSYKRGSTIPWRRTLQKSFIK